MADTLIQSSPSQDIATPGMLAVSNDMTAINSQLDAAAGEIQGTSLMEDSSQQTSILYASTLDKDVLGLMSSDIKQDQLVRSPALPPSGTPTPSTPQSHCSTSSPASQQMLLDMAAAVPPPPYPSHMQQDQNMLITHSPSTLDVTKPNLPPPPKKPLTPYMRFSKSIWQKVKAANNNSSVCEIGARIGKLWREMNDCHKQQYNEDFAHDKARYDEELQNYLKITGLHASDLVKAKVKKSRPSVSVNQSRPSVMKAAGVNDSPSHMDTSRSAADPTAEGQLHGYAAEGVNGNGDGAGLAYPGVSNGVVAGTALPPFSQVWSGSGQDTFNAEQLLTHIGTDGQSLYGQTNTGNILQSAVSSDNPSATMYSSDQGHVMNNASATTSTNDQTSSDQAALTNWIWQQYTTVSGDQQYVSLPESLQATANDPASGGLIIYQLNPDGTQTPYVQSLPVNSAPGPTDALEPGEVRLPATSEQTNGIASDQSYHSLTAGHQLCTGGLWLNADGTIGSVDSEKQLLRSALVEKVREIQRLTRELEKAYALIHQLKQHNDFLQRQWVQVQSTDTGTTGT